jgi:hypothetical protein
MRILLPDQVSALAERQNWQEFWLARTFSFTDGGNSLVGD